jgi:hypothetical protein
MWDVEGKNNIGGEFLKELPFPLIIPIPLIAPYSLIILSFDPIYSRPGSIVTYPTIKVSNKRATDTRQNMRLGAT